MAIWGNNRKVEVAAQEVLIVSDKTTERIARLNGLLAEEKQLLEQSFCKIGQKYAETYEEYNPEVFSALLEKAQHSQQRIDYLNRYVDDLKGILRCSNPKCRHTLSSDSRYCNYCGTKLNIVEYVPCPFCGAPVDLQEDTCIFCGGSLHSKVAPECEDTNKTVVADNPQERICKKCNHVLNADENFCIICGTKYE